MLGNRELVEAVLSDYQSANIPEAEKALFGFVKRVNTNSTEIDQEDIDRLKQVGWSEEAIYDAVTVCSLFNFYNRWIDATGVRDMPASVYEISGKRLKEMGYQSVKSTSHK